MLEYLERSNLFVVPLDTQRRWYRYHPLFAEALRYRFEQTQPDRVRTLHQRASIWYAEHGQSNDAIQHALLARDWQRAAELIEQFRFDVALGDHGNDLVNVRQWIQRLPDEVVRSRPRLCLVYAKTLLDTAPASTIDPWLAAAEAMVRDALGIQSSEVERVSATRPAQENLLGEVVAMRALLAAFPSAELRVLSFEFDAKQLKTQNSNAQRAPETQNSLVEPLSVRELEVFHLMARGSANQEIAEELVLALNTVKRHVSNIIAKLGAANRTQAVAQGRALGLLSDEPSVGSRLLAVAV
jgi:ATP/maltotriose-dependent transcriptional regulator MalT